VDGLEWYPSCRLKHTTRCQQCLRTKMTDETTVPRRCKSRTIYTVRIVSTEQFTKVITNLTNG